MLSIVSMRRKLSFMKIIKLRDLLAEEILDIGRDYTLHGVEECKRRHPNLEAHLMYRCSQVYQEDMKDEQIKNRIRSSSAETIRVFHKYGKKVQRSKNIGDGGQVSYLPRS